ncbi:cyclodeaminase/cyclohydrolase family protein [Deltaproteobacteria bacterium OttesenSCG-928-M10]|nr:cyclodeaminase/cyclohydrolase family protein [Deltaproteobacteria bacterium OttesenSCG-928-M10]
MNYHEVLDLILDTEDATVGGGSAAALSGAMGAGLIGMVARLSKGKNYGLSDDEYNDIERQCRELRQALLDGCVADTEGYGAIVAAFKLPKENADRRAAIEAAGIKAAAAPRDNGRRCRAVHMLGLRLKDRSNSAAGSDLMYGTELAALGVAGCVANIEANLGLIKDEKTVAGFKADIQELREG